MSALGSRRRGLVALPGWSLLLLLASCKEAAVGGDSRWPPAVQRVEYTSTADHSSQLARFYTPGTSEPRPLLVAFHTWSTNYQDVASIGYARWCIDHGWNFLQPDLRGPNNRPEAAGSPLVVADALDSIAYARERARLDDSRIYGVGVSGGGYTALLLAGRAPNLWAGVSAWASVTDLSEWYREARERGSPYARDIVAACGGTPEPGSPPGAECQRRSPLTYLGEASNVPIDLNVGILDGHDGRPIPVDQTLHAYNLLAKPADRLSQNDIEAISLSETIPEGLSFIGTDQLYGS